MLSTSNRLTLLWMRFTTIINELSPEHGLLTGIESWLTALTYPYGLLDLRLVPVPQASNRLLGMTLATITLNAYLYRLSVIARSITGY